MKKIHSLIENFLLSPVHPFLFAIYYIFRMYALNIHDIPFNNFLRPLIISILTTSLMFFVFYMLVKSKHVSAFMTSVFLFMFFFYQQFLNLFLLLKTSIGLLSFIIIYTMLTIVVIFWLGKRNKKNINLNAVAGVNVMGIILLLFPTLQSIRYVIADQTPFVPKVSHTIQNIYPETKPDIYYIILDAYPRADVLAHYGYDNSEFINSLKDLGFYVAECSQSNYYSTPLSLASSLNMEYLQVLSDTFKSQETDLLSVFKMLDENSVKTSVSEMNYKIFSFANGFLWSEWRSVDIFIAPPEGSITEFETVILFSTYARVLHDLNYINLTDIHAERFRKRTLLVLNSFDRIIHEPSPKFAYIHLIVPHAPFAFDENGNPIAPNQFDDIEGYVTQVKFINKFILPELKKIISESENPPIIIIQGDHGPLDKNLRMKILNAYYLPKGKELLYPSISPVNTFRIVFNTYFDTKLPLLEDISYYSDGGVYNFSVVPNTCP